jgi:EmrB/QacA subfamily drug resistance transporter
MDQDHVSRPPGQGPATPQATEQAGLQPFGPLGPSEPLDPRVWTIAAVVFLGPFMAQMDSTVVNVSLATIRQDLGASIGATQWIMSGYLLALALLLPLNAWLVDRVGAKRLYCWCFSAFTLASVCCGLATTMDELIVARIVQGAVGGLLAPMTQMMLARSAGRHLARVMGFTAMPILIAPILGPVIAGAILTHAHWPWLFYVNVPIGIVAVASAAWVLPDDDAARTPRPFDSMGFLLIAPGLAGLLYGLEYAPDASSQAGIPVLVLGVVLILAFIAHARLRPERALIDVRLFRIPVFATASLTQFLSFGSSFAGQLLWPLYLITGCGLSPAQAGWLMAPVGVGMLCVYPLMGYLTDRFGCRAVAVTGTLVNTLGTLPIISMSATQLSPMVLIVCMLARGAGQSAIGVPSLSAAYAAIPKERLPLATTAVNILQRLGGPIATTLMALVIARAQVAMPDQTSDAATAGGAHPFLIPIIVLIGMQLLVLWSALRLPARIDQLPAPSPQERPLPPQDGVALERQKGRIS